MKTLQQAIDALDPVELKARKARVRAELRHTDPHNAYYFPGGSLTYRERIGQEWPRRYVVCHHHVKGPEYLAWSADPGNIKLYTALFYAANNIKA